MTATGLRTSFPEESGESGTDFISMRIRYILPCLFLLCLTACPGDKEPGEHVWKEQTDTIERAEEVNRLIMDAADERRRSIDEQSGRDPP